VVSSGEGSLAGIENSTAPLCVYDMGKFDYMLVSHYRKPDQANESFSRFCELGRASPLGTLMWRPHGSESLHIPLRHLGQRGPSLVLMVLVVVTSLLSVHPVNAPAPPLNYHMPIVIDGNGGFTEQNGVFRGNGTASDPYIIEGREITTCCHTPGIAVRNTDDYFVIRNMYIHYPSSTWLVYHPDQLANGIELTNATNGAIEDSQIITPYSSVTVHSSMNILLVDNGVDGLTIDSSKNILVSNNGLGSNVVAIDSSENITISGSGSSGAGMTASSDDVTFVNDHFEQLQIADSTRVTAENNTLNQGVTIRGTSPEQFDSNTITPDNIVNGLPWFTNYPALPVLFYKDCSGLNLDSIEAGELIVANCDNVNMSNLVFAGASGHNDCSCVEVEAAFVSDSVITNVTASIIFISNAANIEVSQSQAFFDIDSAGWVHVFNNVGPVSVSSSSNISITDNQLSYGGSVFDSSNVTVAGNNVPRCDCTGVSVYMSDHVTVSGNDLGGDQGVFVFTSSLVEISDNQISGGVDGGIILNSCSDVSIYENRLSGAADPSYGVIGVSSCGGVNITNNTLDPSWYTGTNIILLKVSLSNSTVIAGNTISNSLTAVSISDSSYTTIIENNIQSNARGVVLNNTDNSSIFHNNFLNNTVQAIDTYSTQNIWDNGYPSGGNYWSDYVRIDNCSGPLQNICPSPDGIGDTPYAFNYNQDRYPLMKPFAPQMFATGKYNPGFLNLNSPSQYLTLSIQLPLGLNVSNVVLSSIRLNSTITLAAGARATVVSWNHPQVLIVKFNIAEVKTLFTKAGHYSLNLTGNIVDSATFRPFAATTVIRVQSR